MKENMDFFEKLYCSEYDNIKRYVRRMITDGNAIEDIVQETFFEAYRKTSFLRNHPNVPGWLRVTAKNKIMKWEEKQKKYSLEADFVLQNAESFDWETSPDDFKMVEAYCTVRKVLSDEELDILRSYYEYGYTSQEMSSRLGITETCFKVRVLRMKQTINNSLQLPLFVCTGKLILEIQKFMGEI